MRPLAFLPLSEHQLSLLHRNLYLLGLMTLACGLGWSNALMSIGQFIIGGNWLLEGRYLEKLQVIKNDRRVQLLISIWLVVLLGFLWTENFDYAIKDARVKIPLFILPFVIGSSDKLNKKEWKIVLAVYLISLFFLYLASLGKLFGLIGDTEIKDKRELSIFISHIRYGLNLLIGSALSIYYSNLYGKKYRPVLLILSIVLFSSLLILELYTALGIGLILIATYLIKYLMERGSKQLKVGGGILLILSISLGFIFIKKIYSDFKSMPEMSYDQRLSKKTSSKGNPYMHKMNDKRKENGVFIWRYIQKKELKESWNKRSEFDFEGVGKKGHSIFQTLIRYLSSKGLTKDAEGIAQLNDEEIKAIEEGVPNQYYLSHLPIQNRIYSTFYELETYSEFGYAEGYSLGMRLEYWKTAWKIIQKDPWTGVGTGDVPQAFELQYHLDKSSLSEKSRRRAHNQFLTFWLSLGIGGFIYFLYFLFKPLKSSRNSFYPVFFIIAFLSFFTEDTLETQAGVTYFSFFNAILLLGIDQLKSSE